MPVPSHETIVRVRYDEVDRQRVVHHSKYFTYFEIARTEFLRHVGGSYREMEDSGTLLVVTETGARYVRPAGYDDVLSVRTSIAEVTGVRVRFAYEVMRDRQRIATGWTELAACDLRGRPRRLPEAFRGRIEAVAGVAAGGTRAEEEPAPEGGKDRPAPTVQEGRDA